jgi:hypothetical protein
VWMGRGPQSRVRTVCAAYPHITAKRCKGPPVIQRPARWHPMPLAGLLSLFRWYAPRTAGPQGAAAAAASLPSTRHHQRPNHRLIDRSNKC